LGRRVYSSVANPQHWFTDIKSKRDVKIERNRSFGQADITEGIIEINVKRVVNV
jgi:hypothetical protein